MLVLGSLEPLWVLMNLVDLKLWHGNMLERLEVVGHAVKMRRQSIPACVGRRGNVLLLCNDNFWKVRNVLV